MKSSRSAQCVARAEIRFILSVSDPLYLVRLHLLLSPCELCFKRFKHVERVDARHVKRNAYIRSFYFTLSLLGQRFMGHHDQLMLLRIGNQPSIISGSELRLCLWKVLLFCLNPLHQFAKPCSNLWLRSTCEKTFGCRLLYPLG